ncbi:MFS transporter [Kiritimatiella glycovorans]|uniref:Major Facilitator Superfamily protein n=1 Tax=Kiritimatiella glycovorans TaxID=1307763 RepID=A0A0G3EC52_9BACT|nr:MFS transporter [Kiritimatiella glycovorans]AKJ64076.1 Major Facilitator Superfamily protein [Kiritimatiella glycovorans]
MNDAERKAVYRTIIIAQCMGMLGLVLFQNGFMLNYFSKLSLSSADIALVLALPPFVNMLVMLPSAYMSDLHGKKRLGVIGGILMQFGFLSLLVPGLRDAVHAKGLVFSGVVVFSLGNALGGSSWFALLSPLVPEHIRGRFFGRLRVTFQTVTILFTMLVTWLLDRHDDLWMFCGIILVAWVAVLSRLFFYIRIPEVEPAGRRERHFLDALRKVIAVPGFLPFTCYAFLVALFTAGGPLIFALLEKDVLAFKPATITLMGTLLMIGITAGCFLGGRMVDRLGTRTVFVLCHFAYALFFLLFAARGFFALPLTLYIGALTLGYGVVGGSAGIATSSELLALIPSENKSLACSFNMTLISAGCALPGILVSRLLDWEVLSESWMLAGQSLSPYDTMLIASGVMMTLLLVTLGLIPSVIHKVGLYPAASSWNRV